jgi:N-acetylglucosamine repressor
MIDSFKFLRPGRSEHQFLINQSIIFNYLRSNGPISRAKISRDINVSPPAVSRIIEKLIANEYVVETNKQQTKSGKRPTLLAINRHKGFLLGIDLGGENVKMALMDYSGEIVKRYSGPNISNHMAITDVLKNEISRVFIDTKNAYQGVLPPQIKSICIAIPANVDSASGKVISAPLYGSWQDIDLKKEVQSEFKVPVFVENNVSLAAWGEKKKGIGRNVSNVVFLEISNGIRAGIIINNTLLKGEDNYAGEVGFTIAETENIGFKIINKGFLEKFASVIGIKKRAEKAIIDGRKSMIEKLAGIDPDGISPAIIFEACSKGDKLAKEVIENAVKLLSVAIINLILVLNPKVIIIGGYIINMPHKDKLFIDPIKKNIKQTIPFKVPGIEISELGNDAAIIGACNMAMEALLIGEFPYKIDQSCF